MTKPTPQQQRLASFEACAYQLFSFAQRPVVRQKGVAYHNSMSYWFDCDTDTLKEFSRINVAIMQFDANGEEDKVALLQKAIGNMPTYAATNKEAVAHLLLNAEEIKNNKAVTPFKRELALVA